MTGWIIFLIILGIISFILFMPAAADFRYENGKADVKVSYCGITLFNSTKKKSNEKIKAEKEKKLLKKQKKNEKKKRRQSKRAAKGNAHDTDKKQSVGDIVRTVMDFIEPVSKGIRRLFRGIRISRLYLDIKVGAFDSCDCAIKYGKMCTAVSNGLAFFQSFFSIKADHIEVLPRFGTERTVYTVRFRTMLSPAAVIAAGIALGWTYLKNSLRSEQNNTPNPKIQGGTQNAESQRKG